MAWKVAIQKGERSCLGASSNSKDMTTSEKTYSLYSARDNLLDDDSLRSFYSLKPPLMKIGEDVYIRPKNRQNGPSLVARLMGVDMLPFDSKHSSRSDDTETGISTTKFSDKKITEMSSFDTILPNSLWYCEDNHLKWKPNKREHPQEEELQKFKKEFESWQAARFSECSMFSNAVQLIGKEEKLLYGDCEGILDIESLNEQRMGNYEKTKMSSLNHLSFISQLDSGSDRIDIDDDSLNNTPVSSMEKSNIEGFLEEVRERLKSEYQVKHFTKSRAIRGGGIETPYKEKPSDSISKARLIAQEVKNSVSGQGDHFCTVNISECKKKLEAGQQIETYGNSCYGLTENLVQKSCSFRREHDDSPGHLTRSLSAPLSIESLGKLLVEHRSSVTEEWKPEVSEEIYVKIKKQKRDKFSIKEKVSNLLYGKKVKSVEGSKPKENNPVRDNTCSTSPMLNYFEPNENFTEVPPSPASVCSSSVHEDLWRLNDNLSHSDDKDFPYVLKEINSNLNELRRKLNQLEGHVKEESSNKQFCIYDEAETFVRELLTASGLCNEKSSCSLLKWDPLGKQISSCVFEEVEETYKQKTKDDGSGSNYNYESDRVNHKIILDLVNEVLPTILKEPEVKMLSTPSRNGTKLISRVWGMIRESVTPSTNRSFYSRDFSSIDWSRCVVDDIYGIVRDTERHIMKNMIEEMVEDM